MSDKLRQPSHMEGARTIAVQRCVPSRSEVCGWRRPIRSRGAGGAEALGGREGEGEVKVSCALKHGLWCTDGRNGMMADEGGHVCTN